MVTLNRATFGKRSGAQSRRPPFGPKKNQLSTGSSQLLQIGHISMFAAIREPRWGSRSAHAAVAAAKDRAASESSSLVLLSIEGEQTTDSLPDLQDAAVQNVLQQAEALSAEWAARVPAGNRFVGALPSLSE